MQLRVEMRIELTRLHKELGATIIYVTHDQTEAMKLIKYVTRWMLNKLANHWNFMLIQIINLWGSRSPSRIFWRLNLMERSKLLENLKIKKFPKLSKENSKVTIGVTTRCII